MLNSHLTAEYLRRLESVQLTTKRRILGQREGGHRSLKRGHGLEFADYRKYQPGDNLRHIDWNLFGRSDRLYIKEYTEEHELTVLILLDGSGSMRIEANQTPKWNYARDLALSLSYITLAQGDLLRFSVPNHFHSPKISSLGKFNYLLNSLNQIENKSLNNDYQLDAYCASANRAIAEIRFPGIAFYISDFLMPTSDVLNTISKLAAKNLEIVAIQILGELDIRPLPPSLLSAKAVDSENNEEFEISLDDLGLEEYTEILAKHLKATAQIFNRFNVKHILLKPPFPDLLAVVAGSLKESGIITV
ncbi:MAG TPA: DUF58 domain-containing protein [Oligoflexia bacterium]|nr:DUF58 domain-containing protein [Oligoflexia bacterium]HMP26456.1 DUF58 domain-containing protein [Oligoflexia bacterium]